MKQRRSLDQVGLRLSRQGLRALKERGIFVRAAVSLEHQHLAKRYVVRGVESGGAVGDIGRYVTFTQEDGQPIEWLHPVEAIGVNGLHAVVVAPVLVRVEMLRKGRTYELLITRHRPRHSQRRQATSAGDKSPVSRHSRATGVGPVGKGQEPIRLCSADVLLVGRRSSHHPKTVSRGGSRDYRSRAVHRLFPLSLRPSAEGSRNGCCSRRTRKQNQRAGLVRSRRYLKGVDNMQGRLKNYALVIWLFVFLFGIIGSGLHLAAGGAFLAALSGAPLLVFAFYRQSSAGIEAEHIPESDSTDKGVRKTLPRGKRTAIARGL